MKAGFELGGYVLGNYKLYALNPEKNQQAET